MRETTQIQFEAPVTSRPLPNYCPIIINKKTTQLASSELKCKKHSRNILLQDTTELLLLTETGARLFACLFHDANRPSSVCCLQSLGGAIIMNKCAACGPTYNLTCELE